MALPSTETSETKKLLRYKKIQNFKQRKAIIVTIHVTHHAGTFFCNDFIKYNTALRVPDFACLTPISRGPAQANWTVLRDHYDVYSWEYRSSPTPLLDTADWESDEVLSVLIIRDPIDRLLAGDGITSKRWGPESQRNASQWWEFANFDAHCQNYAYQVLTGDRSGSSPGSMERAKKLVDRMDFIIDQDCLNENLVKLAKILGLNNTEQQLKSKKRGGTVHHPPARDRIGNDTVWKYLLERNKAGIELNEYAKQKSVFICNPPSPPNTSMLATGTIANNANISNGNTTTNMTTETSNFSSFSWTTNLNNMRPSFNDTSIYGIQTSTLLISTAFIVLPAVMVALLIWRNRQCIKKSCGYTPPSRNTSTSTSSSHSSAQHQPKGYEEDEEVRALL